VSICRLSEYSQLVMNDGDVVKTISGPVSSAHRVYAEAEQRLEVFGRGTIYFAKRR
jgi:hypothetical protein